ncbi:MAG: 4-oxalocrotonate decarboxylase [Actinobacteria bacterium]|nr:4-oxalocrotonate decarboxylase [Actinomycetota bacterium]
MPVTRRHHDGPPAGVDVAPDTGHKGWTGTGIAPAEAAAELHDARRDRRTVRTFTGRGDDLDLAWAYAVQDAGLALRRADGEQLVGGKLGFTSRAMQRAMGVAHPNYGWLTDAMLLHEGRVDLGRLIHPKVEPELAFLLGADVPATAGTADVLAATAAVLPCLEVVDSRYDGFRFGPLDNIADNSSAGGVVLGDPVPVGDRDLALIGCVLSSDAEVTATAAGAAALDHPAAAVAWMARTASVPLRAGQVVISGGLTAPVDLTAGTAVRAEFGRIGAVELHVT